MNTKKVLIFTGSFIPRIGGAEIAIYNIAKTLANKGLDVLVLCGGTKKDTNTLKQNYDVNFKVARYPFGFKFSGILRLNILFSMIYLLYFIILKKYRIVHAHFTYHPGYTCYLLKKFVSFNYILTPHGNDIQKLPEINYGIRLRPSLEKKIYRALRGAQIITSVSNSIREELNDIPNLKPENFIDIPNGFDQSKYITPIKCNIREAYNLPLDSTVLLSVGRKNIVKNYNYSIKAIKHLETLCEENIWDKLYYVIIGKDVKSYESMVREFELTNKIILSDPVINQVLIDYYRTSDMLLNPSLIESFGLINVEAMAAGIPVIATNVPGNRDVVSNKAGFLVDVDHPEEMAEKIYFLLKNPDERKNLSQTAIIESRKYHWDKITDKYIEVYERVKKNHPRLLGKE